MRTEGSVHMHDLGDPIAPRGRHSEGVGHEWRGMLRAEDLRRVLLEHRRAEGPPALAVLDPLVNLVGRPETPRVAEYAAVPQRPRPELHTPLEPGHDLAVREQLRSEGGGVLHPSIGDPPGIQLLLDLSGGELGPVVSVTHRPKALSVLNRRVGRGSNRDPGVAGSWRDVELVDPRVLGEEPVQRYVERTAPRKAEASTLLEVRPEVVVDQRERGLLERPLRRSCDMDVRLVGRVSLARRAEALHELPTEALRPEALAVRRPDVVEVEPHVAVAHPNNVGEIDAVGVPVGRHPHELVLAIGDLETQVLRHRRVEEPQRVRLLDLVELSDPVSLSDREHRTRHLAHAVDRHDCRALEAGEVIGAGRVRQMVLDALDPDTIGVDLQGSQHAPEAS